MFEITDTDVNDSLVIRLQCPTIGTTVNIVGQAIMIRRADIEDNTYVTYQQDSVIKLSTPIVLYGIDNKKDRLCKQDGTYGVLRNITKFTPSANISYSNNKENYFLIKSSSLPRYMYNYDYGFSTHFTNVANYNDLSSVDYGYSYHYSGIYIKNKDTNNIGNYIIDPYINFFKNNIVDFYYVNSPVFEPLPITDQIALHQLKTMDVVSYISVDSEIEPIMEVDYGVNKIGALVLKNENEENANILDIRKTCNETMTHQKMIHSLVTITSNSWVTSTEYNDCGYMFEYSISDYWDAYPEWFLKPLSGIVPTNAEKTAFDLIVAMKLDTTSMSLKFYASTKPSTDILILVKGVM